MWIRNFLVIETEGQHDCYSYESNEEGIEKLLHDMASVISFSDCTDQEVTAAAVEGREIAYCGWEPNMVFRFRYVDTGEEAFVRQYSILEH